VVVGRRFPSDAITINEPLTETDTYLDDPAEVMAAVDLGSNSFHMVVARVHHGQLSIVDRLKEMVRLGSGLRRDGTLDETSQEKALACLRRFGHRLRAMHADQVRVVGTNTLRKARRAERFVAEAEEALGHSVAVISGFEEARLIYAGVSHSVERSTGTRLVVDIGGGSTELIIGEHYEPRYLESLSLGCARITSDFFDGRKLTTKRFARARLAARLALRPVAESFKRLGWQRAFGSSGTIRAAAQIAHGLGLMDRGVNLAALEVIIQRIVDAGRFDSLALPGLSEERRPIFPAGLAILAEVLGNLDIEHMDVSDGALREGLLYEMLGRAQHVDAREVTIRALQKRYHVDREQARRVERTAQMIFDQVADAWQLSPDPHLQLLRWAARLHEVGLDISHSRYHHHGGYLLENADLPGFVRLEQQLLATLVNYHRRKLDEFSLRHLQERWRTAASRMIVILRLAVLLNRTRSRVELPDVMLRGVGNTLEIVFPDIWYESHPLTEADLLEERAWLRACDFDLRLMNRETRGNTPADRVSRG
jgi:exopolyphosphatase/guanosine-5'-triphosphate,3'-diphosphate pyrophosphatase